MNDIIKFKKFKKLKNRITAGVVFIYKNKILLLHPKNEKWTNSFSYPKGGINDNENIIDAAIRETEEEIGIKLPKKFLLDKPQYRIVNKDEEFNDIIKIDYYYIIYLNDKQFKKLFNNDLIINFKNLQKDEVDWGGFLDKKSAQIKIKPRLKEIVNVLN